MEKEHIYETSVKWTTDRRGIVSSSELKTQIEVATPPQFPKGIEGVWSPEHFLVAAVNTCLMTTFLAIAENSKLEFLDFNSNGLGKLEMVESKYQISEITLMPIVTVANEHQKERALRVLEKSEANCLISNSIRSKIVFKPEVKVVNILQNT